MDGTRLLSLNVSLIGGKQIMRFFLLLFLVVSLSSCSFESKFSQVKPGLTRSEIKNLLGDPMVIQNGVTTDQPFWGPQEGLDGILGVGAPFEEWLYKEGDQNYYIWFGAKSGKPKSSWLVIRNNKYPEGVVFEAKTD